MNNSITDKARKLLKLLNIKTRGDLLAFFISLFIATVLWFLIVLNDTYTTNISYPIAYKNIPKNKTISNELPKRITLTIQGNGFDLITYQLNKFLFPYVVNIQKLTTEQKSNRIVLQTNNILPSLTKKFKASVKITNISPSEIYIDLSNIIRKKLPVKSYFTYTLAHQYVLDGKIKISPKKITVTGPETIIDTLHYIETEHFDFGKINKVIKRTIPIKKYSKIKTDTKYVTVYIPAYKYTENSLQIPIILENKPDTIKAKLIPQKVTVKYKVALKNYKKVKPENFIILADFNNLENGNNTLKLYLRKKSRYAFDISIYPQKVKVYIVE